MENAVTEGEWDEKGILEVAEVVGKFALRLEGLDLKMAMVRFVGKRELRVLWEKLLEGLVETSVRRVVLRCDGAMVEGRRR